MKPKSTKFAAILFILISMFFFQNAQSQILISLLLGDKLNSDKLEFGIDGGLSRSNLYGIDGTKGLNNFNLGFYFDFKLNERWYLNTGVRVKSNTGATNLAPYHVGDTELDSVLAEGHVTRKIGYFHVPIHVKYRFAKQFYGMAGFQVGLRNKAKDLFYNTIYEKDDVEYTYDIGDEVKRLDFGFSGGFGYKFKGTGMNLGITYYYGIVDIMKSNDVNSTNSTFYLYVCIPVGAGKKVESTTK